MKTKSQKQFRIEILDFGVDQDDKKDVRKFIDSLHNHGLTGRLLTRDLVEIIGPKEAIEAYLSEEFAEDEEDLQDLMSTVEPYDSAKFF